MNSKRPFIRWGIIGCGHIAVDKSLPALLTVKDARLAAIADPQPERLTLVREAAARADSGAAVREYVDYRDLLNDPEVDAVYIALPTGMHAPAVVAAAESGKAILCEKPLGRNAAETRRMIQAARTKGVPLMTAYMSRFGDTYRKAAELLAEGAIGQVTFVYANFSYPAMGSYPPGSAGGWRWTDPEGGGPLLDIGIYIAFGLRELLNDTVARVGAFQCDTVAPAEATNPDTTVAWFQTAKGVPGVFAATFSHAECRLLFYGMEGRLDLQRCFSQRPTGYLSCRARGRDFELVTDVSDTTPHYENYRREFEHFTHALLGDKPFRPDPEETMTDALLLDALKGDFNGGTEGTGFIPDARRYLEQETK